MNLTRKLWKEYRGLVLFLVLLTVFRSTVADWNVVPSGSMLPTIRPGDRILVNKMAYGLRIPLTHIDIAQFGPPRRGDIVTVDSAAAHELLVKRIIGIPGDRVVLRHNVLYVNGVRADYAPLGEDELPGDARSPAKYVAERFDGVTHSVRLSLDNPSPRSSFGAIVVPAGEYLMLGDNRDDSADSRYFGCFPRDEIMGRVRRVAFSLDPAHLDRPRWNRSFKRLDAPQIEG